MALLSASLWWLVETFGPRWLSIVAIITLCVILWHAWHRDEPWELRWVPGVEGGWQTRSSGADDWHEASLHYDYLGPWLIGLHVEGRRRWVWPDSASDEARRVLRRLLLWSSS